MIRIPQGANIQSKCTKETKPIQKLSFPIPIWENPNYEHKTPQKHNLRIKINEKS